MPSKESLDSFALLIKYASLIKIIPFVWDNKHGRLVYSNASRHLFPTYVIAGQLLSRLLFLIANFVVQQSTMSKYAKVQHLFLIGTFSFSSICALHNIWRRFEFQSAINHFLKLHRQILMRNTSASANTNSAARPRPATFSLKVKIYEKSMKTWPTYFLSLAILFVIDFIRNPLRPWYYYSVLGLPLISIFVVPFAIWEYVDIIFTGNCIMVSAFPLMCYWFVMSRWLKELNVGCRENPLSHLTLYKSFYLLNHEYNLTFSTGTLALFQGAMIGFPVCMLHALIRFYAIIPPLFVLGVMGALLMSAIFVAFAYPLSGDINTHSKAYLKLVSGYNGEKGMSSRELVGKQLKSCQELKVFIGPFFYVKRHTSCRVFGLISYWAAKSLLFYKI